jgi:hypothetical protein
VASIVDQPPDDNPAVRQISPEAALWLVRRSAILDYLNDLHPDRQRHNKNMAAELIRWVQEWCHADEERAVAAHKRAVDGAR